MTHSIRFIEFIEAGGVQWLVAVVIMQSLLLVFTCIMWHRALKRIPHNINLKL